MMLNFKQWLAETGDLNAFWPSVSAGMGGEYNPPKLPPSEADELFTGKKVKKKKRKKKVAFEKPVLPSSFKSISIG